MCVFVFKVYQGKSEVENYNFTRRKPVKNGFANLYSFIMIGSLSRNRTVRLAL